MPVRPRIVIRPARVPLCPIPASVPEVRIGNRRIHEPRKDPLRLLRVIGWQRYLSYAVFIPWIFAERLRQRTLHSIEGRQQAESAPETGQNLGVTSHAQPCPRITLGAPFGIQRAPADPGSCTSPITTIYACAERAVSFSRSASSGCCSCGSSFVSGITN